MLMMSLSLIFILLINDSLGILARSRFPILLTFSGTLRSIAQLLASPEMRRFLKLDFEFIKNILKRNKKVGAKGK